MYNIVSNEVCVLELSSKQAVQLVSLLIAFFQMHITCSWPRHLFPTWEAGGACAEVLG